MSQENVEIVRGLQPPPDADLAQIFAEDSVSSTLLDAVALFVHPDFEIIGKLSIGDVVGRGLDGLKMVWREWLRPFESYRAEIEDVIDLDGRVLVLVRDYGRLIGTTREVTDTGASIWTLREGKVARVEFYPERGRALEAVGLRE
jgi:ketosteroid isomerase-like protein